MKNLMNLLWIAVTFAGAHMIGDLMLSTPRHGAEGTDLAPKKMTIQHTAQVDFAKYKCAREGGECIEISVTELRRLMLMSHMAGAKDCQRIMYFKGDAL